MASPASAPATSPDRSFTEIFNKWVQSIGIIIAAAWGAYTFVYKEVRLPRSVPINITINLQLKKVGSANPKTKLVAVEMRISATNPSSRRVYLLPNEWMVWGYKTAPKEAENPDSFYERTAGLINAHLGQYSERHASSGTRSIVAAGSLFSDNWLSPNETVTRTIIFYVPRDQYDSVLAQTHIPSFEAESGLSMRWIANKERGDIEPALYVVDVHGEPKPASRDEKGHLKDERLKALGYQLATSSAEISLWQ